jgi:ribosome recycling factor
MINKITHDAEMRMQKSVEAFQGELSRLRSGRASPGLLEHVMVDYYGNETPLSQVASVTVENARTLLVNPWEKNLVPVIEKAILTANLGLNPSTSGTTIRVPLPALTEERRRDLVKVVKDEAEKARVSIRNIRRDANAHIKDLLKDKSINEDDERRAETAIQKITDKFIAQVESLVVAKETDLMAI